MFKKKKKAVVKTYIDGVLDEDGKLEKKLTIDRLGKKEGFE